MIADCGLRIVDCGLWIVDYLIFNKNFSSQVEKEKAFK
jgi:hypothetical protein